MERAVRVATCGEEVWLELLLHLLNVPLLIHLLVRPLAPLLHLAHMAMINQLRLEATPAAMAQESPLKFSLKKLSQS